MRREDGGGRRTEEDGGGRRTEEGGRRTEERGRREEGGRRRKGRDYVRGEAEEKRVRKEQRSK